MSRRKENDDKTVIETKRHCLLTMMYCSVINGDDRRILLRISPTGRWN